MAMQTDRAAILAPDEGGPRLPIGFRVPAHVRSTHSADGAIVLDILQGQMFRFNFVGSKILELMIQGLSGPAIAAQLVREFEIGQQMAEADLRDFVETLEKHQLLIPSPELE